MMNDFTTTFTAHPSIMSGRNAAEHVAADLSGREIENPLILYADDQEGKSLLASLRSCLPAVHSSRDSRHSFSGTALPVRISTGRRSRHENISTADSQGEQLRKICSVLQEKNCGGLIVLGGGIIQSLAKLAKIITAADISCDAFREELPKLLIQTQAEKQSWTPVPHYALYADHQDGYEAASLAVLPGFRCAAPCLAPDAVIIDNAFFTQERHTLQTALISLTALIEAMQQSRRNIFIEYMCRAAFSFIKQGTAADAVRTPSGRKAVADAGVFASLIRGNIGFSSVSSLSETFEASGLIGKAEAAAVLLPHLIRRLYRQDKAVFISLCGYLSDAMHYSGLQASADTEALAEEGKKQIETLLADITSRAAVSENGRIAESLVRLSLHHVAEDISGEILELMQAAAVLDESADASGEDGSNASA